MLKGRTMRVPELIAAVRATGYQTGSANFRGLVNTTLAKNRGEIRRVGWGKYTIP